jgi:hypothetical protein
MGDTISGSLPYSTGYGGSQNSHLGSGTNQFQPGQQGYLATSIRLPHCILRLDAVIFTANQPGGRCWIGPMTTLRQYDRSRNIQEEQISGGSVVTLRQRLGESPVLGTNLGDVAGGQTSLQKNGVGTWTLGAQSYTGRLLSTLGPSQSARTAGNSPDDRNRRQYGGTLLLTNNTTNDRINDGAFVTMAGQHVQHGRSERGERCRADRR